MNASIDKAPENKSQSVANGESQMQDGGKSSLPFMDNRPETLAQKKLKEVADNSAQVSKLRAFQEMANKSLQFKKATPIQDSGNNHFQNMMGVSGPSDARSETNQILSDPLPDSSPVQKVSIKEIMNPSSGQREGIHPQSISQSKPPIQRVKLKDIDINDDDLVRSTDEFRDYTTLGVPELRGGTLTEAEALVACRAYARSGYARPMIDFALQAVARGDWDGTTLEHVAGGSVWYHGNASGIHGGEGTSGRKGAAIWLSKNPLTAYGYAKPSTNILRYQPGGTLVLARLTEIGNQIFGDEIERWSRIAGIHGVFTDHGDGMPEIIVFDVANVQYIDTTKLEVLTKEKEGENKNDS